MVDVLIVTFNEELNLPFTLESLRGWANRVFVVDSGSTDRTAEIARSYGATVVERKWEGYAAQKNWALEHLPFESTWIMILDADEAVTAELRDEIRQVVSRPADQVRESGFYINRVFIFMGREIRHCGYFPSWNLRLFKRGHARYEDRQVHEHMITSGDVGFLRHLLVHEDRRGLEHFLAKHNRYSTLEAEEVYASRERWPGLYNFFFDRLARRRFLKQKVLPHLPLPLLWRMFYMYVVRMGFLDGRAGWNLCSFISSYEFYIHAKYQDLKRLGGRMPAVANALSVPEGHGVRQPQQRPAEHATALAAAPPTDVHIASPAVPAPITPAPADAEVPPAAAEPAPVAASPNGKVRRPGKVPVSVLIPTLNESSNMSRCLDHLEWADEVVVVDSGSKDDTCRIAEAYGAHVVNFKWNRQWPKKKNWALRNVPFKHEWVLIVDADEWITPELAEEIERAIRSDRYVGYYVNRRFIFMGQWIRHCGYYPSWNLRLIKRGHGEYEQLTGIDNTGSGDNEVHEHVAATGPVGHLDSDMLHFAFPSIHVFMEKHNRYSNWEAAVQFKGAERESAVVGSEVLSKRRRLKNISRRMPFRPALRFMYSYIIKGGFLDGRAGLVFCRLLAIYEYLSVAKYHELRWAEEDRRQARQLSAVPALNRAAGAPAPTQAQDAAVGAGTGGGK